MRKQWIPVAAMLLASILLAACGGKQSSVDMPALPQNENTKEGFGTVSLAAFGRPDVSISYACEYSDSGAPKRDADSTVTPKQAALSGCAMLLDMLGPDTLAGGVGVRYVERDGARPHYEVYVRGQSMDTAAYAATVDAALGVATYCGYQEALTLGEKNAQLTIDEQQRQQVESDCLAYATERIETLYAVGYVSGDSRTESVEPFAYDRYDLVCHVMLNTGGFEDYYFEYLYDLDDAATPILPLSCTRMEVLEDGKTVTFSQKADETAFPIPRVQHIYRVLCGDAQPLQNVATAPEMMKSVAYAKEMLELAGQNPNRTLFESKSASQQETMFHTEGQYIRNMEDAIRSLPEERLIAELTLIYAYHSASVDAELGEEKAARFSVSTGTVSGVFFENIGLPKHGRDYGEGTLALSREEAAAKGAQLLTDIGADGYALAAAETVTMDRIFTARLLDDSMKAQAWKLLYLLEGDPEFNLTGTPGFYPDGHKQAYIEITIDDAQVLWLTWRVPTSLAFS